MEVSKPDENKNYWLNPEHPNYERWKRGREIAAERGRLVAELLTDGAAVEQQTILDLGSGLGGTSLYFSGSNMVISVDIDKERLKLQKAANRNAHSICANALDLPFLQNSFDIIILQDVIEHLPSVESVFPEIQRVLKPGGIVYISTPNKYALLNIIADPHWGLPLVALLRRSQIKKWILPYFRPTEKHRIDTAQLYSLPFLLRYFSADYSIELKTSEVIFRLFQGHRGIVWSDLHLQLLKVTKIFRLDKMVMCIANNKNGLLNTLFTPTLYLKLTSHGQNSSVNR